MKCLRFGRYVCLVTSLNSEWGGVGVGCWGVCVCVGGWGEGVCDRRVGGVKLNLSLILEVGHSLFVRKWEKNPPARLFHIHNPTPPHPHSHTPHPHSHTPTPTHTI